MSPPEPSQLFAITLVTFGLGFGVGVWFRNSMKNLEDKKIRRHNSILRKQLRFLEETQEEYIDWVRICTGGTLSLDGKIRRIQR